MTVTGCNYWASHAGIRMWSRWDAEAVRADFAKIAGLGMRRIRVFPLWPDFQPLELLCGGHGHRREIAFGDRPLPDTDAGRAGMDPVMVDRLATLLDLAAEAGLLVEVGLITGWMSGRLFVPPAFAGMNVIADPLPLRWQVRFVRHLVRRFKDHPAVACWSPGNECNCLAPADRDQAWRWAHALVSAIRLEDPDRPVSGGMHSLAPADDGGFEGKPWTLQDHGELFDRVNTHPYPLFTPHAARTRVDAFRNVFHAVAETRFYADISGLPGAIEEIGTLSPSMAGEATKAAYIRNVGFNALAHDIPLVAWWCAFDQDHLDYPPYAWNAVERQLGLFRRDGTPKPVADAFRRLADLFASLPAFAPTPADAVCVLTRDQDAWANAWGAFLLARQAGANLRFAYAGDPLPESPRYIVPGLRGNSSLPLRRYRELVERARAGATVYFSLDDGLLSPLDEWFGIESLHRAEPGGTVEVVLGMRRFRALRPVDYAIVPRTAATPGCTPDGAPLFFDHAFGQGRLLLLTLPLERHAATVDDDINRPESWDGRAVYEYFLGDAAGRRPMRPDDPLVTVTDHVVAGGETLVIAVNNRPAAAAGFPKLSAGWRIARTLYGTAGHLPANDAWIGLLTRNGDLP